MPDPTPSADDRPRILLVDDREENLLALEALLRGMGAELHRARSGTQALELLLAHEFALALVDVQMPEMDGFELAEIVRAAPRTREIPIVFITAGLHDRARLFKGYEAGAVDFLLKPLDGVVLCSKVRVFLELFARRRQLVARVGELEQALAERRRAEARLREAEQRRSEFLATLSHELRNPLAPIRNSLYILERAPAGSEQARRALQVIVRQTGQLVHLVDDLLDVTRVSRNRIRLQKERLDLALLVRRTAEDQRSVLQEQGVRLELELPAGPVEVDGDPTRLAQVLGNLLQNAAKFTSRGGEARVALCADAASGRAVLSVSDTGVGMDPAILDRLFEPFAQADATLERSRGGLGLGLALVKGLTELHGGSVLARSDGPGRGSEFVVQLPLAGAPAAPEPEPPQPASRPRRRVLVVEDNLDEAESLREALELDGHEVVLAHDGREGLAKALECRPDAVLCDIGLPGMDGYELARAIRDEPTLDQTLLIAVTGYALPDDLRRAAEAGFAEHLAKPPSLERLGGLLSSGPGRSRRAPGARRSPPPQP